MISPIDTLNATHMELEATGMYNLGNHTVILSSNANSRGEYDHTESLLGNHLADSLSLQLPRLFGETIEDIAVIYDATTAHLESAVRDMRVANILLLGHAAYGSWVASDRLIRWQELGQMSSGHLKDGIFANLGCGIAHEANKIPLGNYVISKRGLLVGKNDTTAALSDLSDITNYTILPRV